MLAIDGKRVYADFFEIFWKVSILYISATKRCDYETHNYSLCIYAFRLIIIRAGGPNGVIVPESDSTVVQRRVAELRDSLNNRKFSDDMTKLRMKAEQLGNKTKETIEEHTPVVKEFMQGIADYLKR